MFIDLVGLYYSIKYICSDIKWWVIHRTVDKYHLVDTGLKPGYYDKDYLLLHSSFNILKNYVETELAWMAYITTEDEKVKKAFRYDAILDKLYIRNFQSSALGLEYLDWEMNLKGNVYSSQRKSAKKIRELYLWWVVTRNERLDTYSINDFEQAEKLRKQYEKEDTYMLCQLMKIRNFLWT